MKDFLQIIYIVQIVIACITEILVIAEYRITKEEYGTGMIFLFVLLLNVTPALGYLTAPVLCVDCINNIKKHKQ